MKTTTHPALFLSSFETPRFLENVGAQAPVAATVPSKAKSSVLIVSDFDHTLTTNDCGAEVARLAGISEPDFFALAKDVATRKPTLEKGAEFAEMMLEEPKMNRAGRAGMFAAIDSIALKTHVGAMYRALNDTIAGHDVSFYVVSAGPQDAVRGALAKVGVPAQHVIGTRFVYDEADRPVSVLHASAGMGKVALIRDLQKLHQVPGANLIYFGDGSSDIEAMKFVRAQGGFNVAVEDSEALRPYRSMLLKSNDVATWIKPVTDHIHSLDATTDILFNMQSFWVGAQQKVAHQPSGLGAA